MNAEKFKRKMRKIKYEGEQYKRIKEMKDSYAEYWPHSNKKFEWSKIICGLIVLYGVANGIVYNVAVFMDKMPDSALAVQSITTIIGGYMSYLLYQFGLKNSRNKFGIDDEGNPYKQDLGDLYGNDKEEM